MEMSIDNFIAKEISVWGFDEIEALLADDYIPILSNRGWKWIKYDEYRGVGSLPTQESLSERESHRSSATA